MNNQTPSPAAPRWAPPADPLATSFDGAGIIVFDLFRATAQAGKGAIENRTFRNCRIEGPAVAAILEGCDFDGVDFGYTAGDIRNMIIRSGTPGKVIGAIPFRNCRFVNCQFFAVGFTGPETFLNQMLTLQTRP
jgi:hypothetical protein